MGGIQRLKCSVQCYDWGCVGEKSLVARLKKFGDTTFTIDSKPYAEMWMGTHPNGPSFICSTNQTLVDYLASHPSVLADRENGNIGFLFKILSVNKPLSIQAHPSKEEAKILHARDPAHYPDDNHKPEMAIALSDFQLLCGFRVPQEIHNNIKQFPEFSKLIGDEAVVERLLAASEEKKKGALRTIFSDLMRSSPESIAVAINSVITRLNRQNSHSDLEKLLIRLHTEFPDDVGFFAPLLLNYFTLKKGESVFLEPNQPHAYLLGDCVECMACSDNTIRAGLTPKFKDVETLVSSLSFKMSPPPYFSPKRLKEGLTDYQPPVNEFAVQQIEHNFAGHIVIAASSIVIVVEGSATLQSGTGDDEKISKGEVIFVPSGFQISCINSSDDFLAYRAFTPL